MGDSSPALAASSDSKERSNKVNPARSSGSSDGALACLTSELGDGIGGSSVSAPRHRSSHCDRIYSLSVMLSFSIHQRLSDCGCLLVLQRFGLRLCVFQRWFQAACMRRASILSIYLAS